MWSRKYSSKAYSTGSFSNAFDNNHNTPLHLAAENVHLTAVEDLINHALIDPKNKGGKTPLHKAVERKSQDTDNLSKEDKLKVINKLIDNKLKIVEKLIKKGANVTSQDNSKETPLHIAAKYGYSKIAAELIKNKADVVLKIMMVRLHCIKLKNLIAKLEKIIKTI